MIRIRDAVFKSVGKFLIHIPAPDQSYMQLLLDFFKPPGVALLINIYIMHKYSLFPDNVTSSLAKTLYCWTTSIVRKAGYSHLERNTTNILYSKSKRFRVHKHDSHPTFTKLYSLLERPKPERTTI